MLIKLQTVIFLEASWSTLVSGGETGLHSPDSHWYKTIPYRHIHIAQHPVTECRRGKFPSGLYCSSQISSWCHCSWWLKCPSREGPWVHLSDSLANSSGLGWPWERSRLTAHGRCMCDDFIWQKILHLDKPSRTQNSRWRSLNKQTRRWSLFFPGEVLRFQGSLLFPCQYNFSSTFFFFHRQRRSSLKVFLKVLLQRA